MGRFAIAVFLFALVVALSLPIGGRVLSENYNITISISDKGFSPHFISIPLGTAVVWINKDNNLHWPASDLHPTHTRYPGSGIEKCGTSEEKGILDACNGLKKNEGYRFKFDKIGNWTLHDHLNPQLGMKIEVINNDSLISFVSGNVIVDKLFDFLNKLSRYKTVNQKNIDKKQMALKVFNSCYPSQEHGSTDKLRCYSKEFKDIAFRQGSEYAFVVLYELQKIDETAKVCHVISHGIGWGTYERNPDEWQSQVAKINPTCVYGAIHGILEAYLDDIGGGKLTKELLLKFCQTNPHATCLHAIGHLALAEVKDNLSDAIELCAVFPKEKNKRHYCLTGVFMEHMIAENLVQHGLYPLERRTYWYKHLKDFENICRSQKGENNTACWTEIVHASSINFGNDPIKVIEYCNNAENEAGKKFCRRHAIDDMFPKKNFSLNSMKWVCALQQPNDTTFERDCYAAMLKNKLLVFSPEASADVIGFCSMLKNEFKSMCFSKIGETFRERYIEDMRISELCSRAPLEFRNQCNGGNRSEQMSDAQHAEEDSAFYKGII